MKIRFLLFSGILSSVTSLATPTISDLKVTPIAPWGVAIDYSVSGATEADEATLCFDVSMAAGATTNVAQTLLGATNCVNGLHRVYWNMAKDGLTATLMNAEISVRYATPRYCVVDLSQGSSATAYPVSYYVNAPDGGFTNEIYKTTKLVLKRVEAGTFTMGRSSESDNQPHAVTLTDAFYMGIYEVTQKQWELVTGSNPCSSSDKGKGGAYPVYYVSYNAIRGSSEGAKWPVTNSVDATSFLGKLRERAKLEFDIPTEAQWEYTCRAGTTTEWSFGSKVDSAYMWYSVNSPYKTHEVGTKLANPWGFYDMHGNVLEWCLDWYGTSTPSGGEDPRGIASGSQRVLRGGAFCYSEDTAASSARAKRRGPSQGSGYYTGFRLSLPVDVEASALATVSSVACHAIAAGVDVGGTLTLGVAPTSDANAVVAVDGEEVVCAAEATMFLWQARTKGEHVISHTVGDMSLSATYNVTNLVFWTPTEPNPPMDVVETIKIAPENKTFVTFKASGASITTEGSGEWTAAVSDDWITLAATSGVAGKSVAYRVAANEGLESRVGYVYVAGRVHKVVQAGCETLTVTLDRTDFEVGATGSVETIAVAPSNAEMAWRVQTDSEWISVLPTEGVGAQTVNIQVAPWCELGARTGTVVVVDQVVTVVQTGSSFAVAGAEVVSAVAQGASGEIAVEATPGLTWTATSDADWLALTETFGSGNGSVMWTAVAQTTFEPRTATITFVAQTANCRAEHAVSVVQKAAKATFEGGNTRCYNADGAFNEMVTVHVDVEDIPWTVTFSDNADGWFYLFSDAKQTGDGVEISFMVDAATVGTTELPRTATVTVGNAALTITQDDGVVITEGPVPFIISPMWFAQYPTLGGTTVAEWQKVAEGNGVKSAPVWHDYVAGTDPTNALSKFTAKVEMRGGAPVVTWSPALNGEGVREGARMYRVWGKANLDDAAWSEVGAGDESAYRFFRVTVEMP